MSDPLLMIAHISDLHLGGRPEAHDRAQRVLDHVTSMSPAPDVLVVTGDIADHGLPSEYAEARRLLAQWPGPLVVGPGNHDVRETFSVGLLGDQRSAPLDQVVEVDGFRILMCDSLVPAVDGVRIDHGLLGDETLRWLDAELGASSLPAFVCLHHPATTVGIVRADEIQLHNGPQLAEVLDRHPHVVAVLVGHNHLMGATTFAGRPMLVGGGVVSGVTLDQEPLDHVWLDAPPTIAFHLVDDTGRLTTHWRALP